MPSPFDACAVSSASAEPAMTALDRAKSSAPSSNRTRSRLESLMISWPALSSRSGQRSAPLDRENTGTTRNSRGSLLRHRQLFSAIRVQLHSVELDADQQWVDRDLFNFECRTQGRVGLGDNNTLNLNGDRKTAKDHAQDAQTGHNGPAHFLQSIPTIIRHFPARSRPFFPGRTTGVPSIPQQGFALWPHRKTLPWKWLTMALCRHFLTQ